VGDTTEGDEMDTEKRQQTGKRCRYCGGRLFDAEGNPTHRMAPKPRPRTFIEKILASIAPAPTQRRMCDVEGVQRADGAIVWRRVGLERAPFLPSMDPTRKAAS
jgi:hypothetical protein